MQRVGLVVHPTRPVRPAVETVERWTEEHGLGLVQIPAGEQPAVAPAGEVSACDLVVALGGDGTILKALHASAGTRTPVLGVAYGSLGALTAVPAEELRSGLDRFAAGAWLRLDLPALQVHAADGQTAAAVNDLVVARGRGTQLVVDVYVDDELYVRLAGDGVVLATPLGSSAYSMAAGGPLLAAGADAFLCTPLAMHGGCAPPLVVAGREEVRLDVHPGYSGFHVDVDGFPVATEARRLAVKRRRAYASLVALKDAGSALASLRARGLIRDSPRLVGQERLAAQLEPTR
jgi:NAD+ kinase